jgi:hypothetical protein
MERGVLSHYTTHALWENIFFCLMQLNKSVKYVLM